MPISTCRILNVPSNSAIFAVAGLCHARRMAIMPADIAARLRLAWLLHRAAVGPTAAGVVRDMLADSAAELGAALHAIGQSTQALASADEALLLAADHVAALHLRGVILMQRGRPAEAWIAFEKAASLHAGDAELWARGAFALHHLGRFADAVHYADRALAITPDHLNARISHGISSYFLRRFAAALEDFAAAQLLHPDDAGVRYNAALVHLAMGDFATGWAEYEARWVMAERRADSVCARSPQWRGQAGGTVLLWSEQGLGDTLQFCRYAILVARRSNVILQVPQSLLRLLSDLPGVSATIVEGTEPPPHDWQSSLMSLPHWFGTVVDCIPADGPYLHADADAVARWSARLSRSPGGLRVGLVWAGNPRLGDISANAIDRRRSIPLADLAPLAGVPGVTLVSLQKSAPTPLEFSIMDWTDDLTDFADTAALVMALDLVIAVDTAVAHLAGALGRPVWILNRYDACWRWLDGRDDSPWYPTARLFRQTSPGDWADVIARVASALHAFAQGHGRHG